MNRSDLLDAEKRRLQDAMRAKFFNKKKANKQNTENTKK